MSAAPIATLASNVVASTRTADEVLAHFEAAVRRAGFEQGLDAYRKMGETLVAQRLWSRSAAPSPEIDRLFDVVAARARSLYGLLAPYAEVMRMLGALGAEGTAAERSDVPARAAPAAADTPTDPVLEALRRGEKSLTALKAAVGLPRQELERRLGSLVSEKRIVSRLAGGRRIYRLP